MPIFLVSCPIFVDKCTLIVMVTGDITHLCTEIIHRHVENKAAKFKLEVARILIPKIRECYALKVLGECSVDILKDCEDTIKCIGKRQ